jgi:pimeloyl-ACP methyl ester carboxylesterase
MLRLVQHRGDLRPGARAVIQTANRECELEVKLVSDGWQDQDFNRFEFASDYEVHGLRNHYRNFGLGVPLIAMRTDRAAGDPRERFYPPKVTFPVTALLRVTPEAFEPWPGPGSATDVGRGNAKRSRQTTHAVLELHDPFTSKAVQIANRQVPLETDLSTPLAYFLNQPEFDDNRLSTLGLLMPERVEKLTGLYMLEPFQPDKMPVLMVHGLWSSPVTWMEMFNDLRSDPRIRDHYQFWFYLYPSGQPFWYSAAQMREDLARARQVCDPKGRLAALDQMVLVGHSMGGLVSKLQTTNSGNEFWATISDRSFAELQAAGEVRDSLARTFFFRPNPSIRRIVTIGTPHRGSHFANDFTRWLGRKAISIPSKLMHGRQQIVAHNPGYFRAANPLEIITSIDSLSPSSRVLEALLESEQTPFLRHHNIVGRVSHDGVVGSVTQSFLSEGDGVVPLASAQLDEVASQIVVPADHTSVHRHPQSILEVRRILLEQIDELRQFPGRRPQRAVSHERHSAAGVHPGVTSGTNERL